MRNRTFFYGLILLFFISCSNQNSKVQFSGIYNILDYGAVNDNATVNTEAFRKAIDACTQNGGGQVLVPPGKYVTGTILLKDNVELHLMKGATIYGALDSIDYWYKVTDTTAFKKDGKNRQVHFGLIMADGAENIALTGFGVIDGNGGKSKDYLAYPLNDGSGGWHKPPRPKIIMFYNSKNIKVHDVTTINSNAWTQHYKLCQFVEIQGIKLNAHANANGDGIDLDQCKDVMVSNCILDADDDAMVLKALGTNDCEHITITNCIFSSKITAIKTGTESGGGFKNIAISNCIIRASYEKTHFDKNRQQMSGSGIALKVVDGGVLDGVTISNIVMEDCYAPFFFRLGDRKRKYAGKLPEAGAMRNIIVENIICKRVRNKYTSTISAFPGHYIENLTMSNIRMECNGGIAAEEKINPMPENLDHYPWPGMYGKEQYPAYGLWFRHVKNLKLNNIQIEYKAQDVRPAVHLEDVVKASITDSDFEALKEPIKQVNCKNITIK